MRRCSYWHVTGDGVLAIYQSSDEISTCTCMVMAGAVGIEQARLKHNVVLRLGSCDTRCPALAGCLAQPPNVSGDEKKVHYSTRDSRPRCWRPSKKGGGGSRRLRGEQSHFDVRGFFFEIHFFREKERFRCGGRLRKLGVALLPPERMGLLWSTSCPGFTLPICSIFLRARWRFALPEELPTPCSPRCLAVLASCL